MGNSTETGAAAVVSDPAEILATTIRALLHELERRDTRVDGDRCRCVDCERLRRLTRATKITLLVFEASRAGLPLQLGLSMPAAAGEQLPLPVGGA